MLALEAKKIKYLSEGATIQTLQIVIALLGRFGKVWVQLLKDARLRNLDIDSMTSSSRLADQSARLDRAYTVSGLKVTERG